MLSDYEGGSLIILIIHGRGTCTYRNHSMKSLPYNTFNIHWRFRSSVFRYFEDGTRDSYEWELWVNGTLFQVQSISTEHIHKDHCRVNSSVSCSHFFNEEVPLRSGSGVNFTLMCFLELVLSGYTPISWGSKHLYYLQRITKFGDKTPPNNISLSILKIWK